MKIRPLGDRILVKRIEEEDKTSGGIIIPDSEGRRLDDGKLQPLDVKRGNRVLFGKYAGTEVTVEGEEHLIIREDDVLGIME